MTMISLFRMIELVGQKVLAAALIVGLSLGFGFLPAVLAKKYLQHSQKSIRSTHTDLIFVTNIISGEKIVRWRNFSFPCKTIVGKVKISPPMVKFQMSFIAIYAVLLLNLLCMLFCCEILPRAFMWRKIEPKMTFVEKK